MARGTVVGEKVVSQANNRAFEEGYSRIYGDRAPVRGRWIYDAAQGKCVPADEYQPPERAVDAPILSGRFYENTKATDGTDIGSRTKHRRYMKEHGVTLMSDFSPQYLEGVKRAKKEETRRERREVIARRLWEIDKP